MIRILPIFLMLSGVIASVEVRAQVSTVMELDGQRLAVSTQEMRSLSNLGSLVRTGSKGAQDRALMEARRVANSRDARHVLALYELEIGTRRADDVMRARALDMLVADPMAPKDKVIGFMAMRGQIAYRSGDFDLAGKLWERWAELAPSNADALANLAQVRLAQKNATGASDLMMRAIAIRKAADQVPPEAWYRQSLSIAQQGKLIAPGIAAARTLVAAYPTAANWRAALSVYRELTTPQGAVEIDLLRLMRYVGALLQAAEYQRMAQLLNQTGESKEAKAVLDEGVARNLLDAGTSPTRDIIAEVDRSTGKARTGLIPRPAVVDPAGTQIRLGMSQLFAGRQAEAEATFRNATGTAAGGRYADLASFWLAALAQRMPLTGTQP